MRDKILVVDDVEMNRVILREILCDDYDIIEAADGFEAINILYNDVNHPSLVLLDIMMPEMDGFEVLSYIKANPSTTDIPVIFITANNVESSESRGLREGAADFIVKPINPDVVKARIWNHLQLKHYNNMLNKMVDDKITEIVQTRDRVLETLASLIEYRSTDFGRHLRRTCELYKILVNEMLKSTKFNLDLMVNNHTVMIKSVYLHDVGKIAIPEAVLLKPEKLTDEEFEVIKTHTIIGNDIIDSLNISNDKDYIRHCKEICRSHHEHINGNGYPDGLKGEEIPLSARIMSVIDVYDALTSDRIFRGRLSHNEASSIIISKNGTQFDSNIIECFIKCQEQLSNVTNTE